MARIFISYRRDDSAYVASMLAQKLTADFGAGSVFMDVDNIPIGVDFRKHLQNAVEQADVLLTVIGDDWLNAANPDGTRRLDDPADFVRIEIAHALQRGIPIVPVLSGTSHMPSSSELPAPLTDLAFSNAAELRAGRDLQMHLNKISTGVRDLLDRARPRHQKLTVSPDGSSAFSSTTLLSNARSQSAIVTPETGETGPSRLLKPLGRFGRNLFLLYRPRNVLAGLFQCLFYLSFAFSTLMHVFIWTSPSPEGVSDDPAVRILSNICIGLFTYGPIYVLFWFPAHRLNQSKSS